MARRWLSLFLGVALLQGAFSFSPIYESNDEWAEFSKMLRDVRYRLPGTTVPTEYQVHLTPNFEEGPNQFTFGGEVTIRIRATQANVQQIRLHCNDLTISSATVVLAAGTQNPNLVPPTAELRCGEYDFLDIPVSPALSYNANTPEYYLVTITFTGNLQTNMRGFYRSWYKDQNGNTKWIATTQFQPGHARQAFPCYDEPSFKARFDISITRDIEGFTQTLSNMPFKDSQQVSATKIRENFETTPTTSTYLLAFIVSDYTVAAHNDVEGTVNTRPFHIYARSNNGDTGNYSLEIGERLLHVMEEYTSYDYYLLVDGSSRFQMNMKQAAIPDFSAGAMENWGLLTYREALILYDPVNTNNFYKQRIANIISHEIAHMWFGNLVTCDWWDNLWLNEGFARFYQYYLTDAVAPEMGFDARFIIEQVQVSLLSDSSREAHALTNPSVSSPSTVSNHFSQITYGKGAAVLRMTQHLLGNQTYIAGLRQYLRTNEFKTAQPAALFTALQNAAAAANALQQYPGITVAGYFATWSTQAGHPLLTVTVDRQNGKLLLRQERFFLDGEPATETDGLWQIPITWTRAGDTNENKFINLKPSKVMIARTDEIDVANIGQDWVIFNLQQSGFYRVHYDENTWLYIARALRNGDERQQIHKYNRAQIVDDVFLLARAYKNKMSYNRAFTILSFLEFEDQYEPWLAAITGFNFVLRRLAHGSFQADRLRRVILDMSTAVVNRLGFVERPSDTFMDNLQRMHVMTFLCSIGHQGCIHAARTSFANWRTNATPIPPNMRPWVYCNGLRYGTSQDFQFFWDKYLETNLANEQVVMLTAAGCTTDQPSLNRFLVQLTAGQQTNFIIRSQDYSTAISSAVTSNEANTLAVFQWLQNNLQRTIDTPGVIGPMLNSIANRLLSERQIDQVTAWINENQNVLGALPNNVLSNARDAVDNSRRNIEFYNERLDEFVHYFQVGYDNELDPTTTPAPTQSPPTQPTEPTDPPTPSPSTEPTTEETTPSTEPTTTPPTTTQEPTTQPTTEPTTPEPDSANIASLSIVTLIVTLVINMV